MASWRYDQDNELDSLRAERRRYAEMPPLTPDCIPVRARQCAAIDRHIARMEAVALEEAAAELAESFDAEAVA